MTQPTNSELESKINDLEASIALLARDLQDMSDVVRSQQVEIDRLVATTKRLEDRGLPPLPPAMEEKPPHY